MSERSFTLLVRRHHEPLVTHVRGKVGSANDAEDIVQETWLRAADKVGSGQAIRNIRAYLYRIAGNLSVDYLRRRSVRRHLEAASIEDGAAEAIACPSPNAEQALLAREWQARFEAALARLPVRARRVLLLSRVEGWSYPRIAGHLGISLRTVSNDMEKALGECLRLLSSDE